MWSQGTASSPQQRPHAFQYHFGRDSQSKHSLARIASAIRMHVQIPQVIAPFKCVASGDAPGCKATTWSLTTC